MSHTDKPKRAVLCDDEPQSRLTLKVFLNDYCPDVEIVGEADGVMAGIQLIRQARPDVVFLDVEMEDGTGFDLLKKFPNPSFQVIFTTAYNDFALKAFRYNALDYLLKPIDIDELIQAVDRISPGKLSPSHTEQITALLEANHIGRFEKIAVSSNEGLHFLNLKDIVRLESDINYTTFHLASSERITVSKTLKTFEELLPEGEFYRPHQSHIVNLGYVKKVLREEGGYLVMEDGFKIPLSRARKDEFLNLVNGRYLK